MRAGSVRVARQAGRKQAAAAASVITSRAEPKASGSRGHSPLSEPDISGDRIFIKCGQRNLLIGKFKIQGKVSMSVSESIGELPSR
jgi:hypothetical protein